MTINGKRDFTYNGKKYHVTDLPNTDRVDNKKLKDLTKLLRKLSIMQTLVG